MRSFVTFLESSDEPNSDLVTLEEVKAELGITGTSEDVALALRISRVSKAIGELCDRDFALRDVQETFYLDWYPSWPSWQSPSPWNSLRLHHYPIVSIDSVEVDEVATIDYEYNAVSGRLWPTTGVWSGRIDVLYTGGYDLPDDAPSLLSSIAIEATRQSRSIASQNSGIRQISREGVGSVTFVSEALAASGGFSDSIIGSLQSFRRISA